MCISVNNSRLLSMENNKKKSKEEPKKKGKVSLYHLHFQFHLSSPRTFSQVSTSPLPSQILLLPLGENINSVIKSVWKGRLSTDLTYGSKCTKWLFSD